MACCVVIGLKWYQESINYKMAIATYLAYFITRKFYLLVNVWIFCPFQIFAIIIRHVFRFPFYDMLLGLGMVKD